MHLPKLSKLRKGKVYVAFKRIVAIICVRIYYYVYDVALVLYVIYRRMSRGRSEISGF